MIAKEEIILAISSGSLDADLDTLVNYINARRDRVIKAKVFTTLVPGAAAYLYPKK